MKIPILLKSYWFHYVQRFFVLPSRVYRQRMGIHRQHHTDVSHSVTLHTTPTRYVEWIDYEDATCMNLRPAITGLCRFCLSEDMRIVSAEGVYVCADCGTIHDRPSDAPHLQPAITLPRTEVSGNTHKRTNHFKYWLHRIQGTERCGMTSGEEFRIYQELKKRGYDYGDECIDFKLMRSVLKSLQMTPLYNHVYYVIKRFTGHALVEFTSYHEQCLCRMFTEIQAPFAKYARRVNMLSYLYLIRKFCEILGWTGIASNLPTLKSATRVHAQDVVWRRICEDIGYPFYPTLF